MQFIVSGLLFFAGVIAGWFIPESAVKHEVVKMIVSIFLIILIVLAVIYHKRLLAWLSGRELSPDEDD